MKVAYLLGSLNRGGTETLLLDIFKQSAKLSFEIIGIYRKDGEMSSAFLSTKVPVFKIETRPVWLIWLYLWSLRKRLKREKVNIVHTQQRLDTIYGRIACIGLNIKVVQTFHEFDFDYGGFHKLLVRLSLKMSDINIFVSSSQRKYYSAAYNCMKDVKSSVVYNGIDFEKLHSNCDYSIRSELSIEKDIPLMGMVGNFVKVRDQMTICRFLKLLNQKGIDFTFAFIGEKDISNPSLYDDCVSFCRENGIEGKVRFLGSRSDVPSLLSQLDAFIYSSDHDTFGIAVIEAISTEIPVFVNDWEVMKEITENGKYAILYKTKDENDLLAKFIEFLNQPEKFRKSALGNAAWARQTYSIKTHCKQLHEVYQEVLY